MALSLPAAVVCAACTGFLTTGTQPPETVAAGAAWACGVVQSFEEAARAAQPAPAADIAAIYFQGLKVSSTPKVLICGPAN